MICNNCGADNPDTNTYCNMCNSNLFPQIQYQNNTQVPSNQDYQQPIQGQYYQQEGQYTSPPAPDLVVCPVCHASVARTAVECPYCGCREIKPLITHPGLDVTACIVWLVVMLVNVLTSTSYASILAFVFWLLYLFVYIADGSNIYINKHRVKVRFIILTIVYLLSFGGISIRIG